jgi:hypothetical protein
MTAAGDEAVLARLDVLIEAGDDLAGRASGFGDKPREFYSELSGWRARAITAIGSIVGKDHPYYASFEDDAPTGTNAQQERAVPF